MASWGVFLIPALPRIGHTVTTVSWFPHRVKAFLPEPPTPSTDFLASPRRLPQIGPCFSAGRVPPLSALAPTDSFLFSGCAKFCSFPAPTPFPCEPPLSSESSVVTVLWPTTRVSPAWGRLLRGGFQETQGLRGQTEGATPPFLNRILLIHCLEIELHYILQLHKMHSYVQHHIVSNA